MLELMSGKYSSLQSVEGKGGGEVITISYKYQNKLQNSFNKISVT